MFCLFFYDCVRNVIGWKSEECWVDGIGWLLLKQMTYGQKKIPLPFNHDIFNWSNETRRILETAKLPVGVKFYNLFGTDNDTPLDVWYVFDFQVSIYYFPWCLRIFNRSHCYFLKPACFIVRSNVEYPLPKRKRKKSIVTQIP